MTKKFFLQSDVIVRAPPPDAIQPSLDGGIHVLELAQNQLHETVLLGQIILCEVIYVIYVDIRVLEP